MSRRSRKREKPYSSAAADDDHRKRSRSQTTQADEETTREEKSPATVMVAGVPPECSLLELKSRLQIYGCISRTTVQPVTGVAYVTFRSSHSALSAVNSLSPITLLSLPVQVTWAANSVPLWRESVSQKEISPNSFSSKLVRPEVPLSRHGRSKRLGSTIVNPRAETTDSVPTTVAFKGREIIAYDDIL